MQLSSFDNTVEDLFRHGPQILGSAILQFPNTSQLIETASLQQHDILRLDMRQRQYRSSQEAYSMSDDNSHSYQSTSHSSWYWLHDVGASSQLSWSYSQGSTPGDRHNAQLSTQSHQLAGQRGGSLRMLTTNLDAFSVSNVPLVQQTAIAVEADDEDVFFMEPDENTLVLDPGGSSLEAQFDMDLPDLMFPPLDSQASDMYALRLHMDLQLNPALSEIHHVSESFEGDYPLEQVSSSAPARPIPLLSNDAYIDDCVAQLQAMSAASGPIIAELADTRQTNGMLVFDSTTGAQQRPAIKKRRRKTSEAQRLHRNLIRDLGGQCESCKARKRRCQLLHLVSESRRGAENVSSRDLNPSGAAQPRGNLGIFKH